MTRTFDQDEVSTIYALSSGRPPCGVCVVRISGPKVRSVLKNLTGQVFQPRQASLSKIVHPQTGQLIDRALILYFPAPHSFTGEDVAELHIHGSPAVLALLLDALSGLEGLAPADAGAFTRRAFYHGKMDLTQVDGLGDLLKAETEAQHRQALYHAEGHVYTILNQWRDELLHIRAFLEASLDFADEDDVPSELDENAQHRLRIMLETMKKAILDQNGERIRDGFCVVLLGPPNVGKSSLLNALAKRDVAIVTDIAGTTRDIISVDLNLKGLPVRLTDTAGLRDSDDPVEQEGIRRARLNASQADCVLYLQEYRDFSPSLDVNSLRHSLNLSPPTALLLVLTKCDEVSIENNHYQNEMILSVSAKTGYGLDKLCERLSTLFATHVDQQEPSLITHARQRQAMQKAAEALERALEQRHEPVLLAEELRSAHQALGQIVGKVDVEDILDVVFSSFCIGK
jgi:tRNA modification GTPase